MKTGIVLLAAGGSSRLGKPKQLVELNGEYLINHVISAALEVSACKTVLVVGGNKDQILPEIKNIQQIIVVENKLWKTGVASSIKRGLQEVISCDGVILSTTDQPAISSGHLKKMIDQLNKGNLKMIASSYKGTIGIPAIFKHNYFQELMSLKGDKGAKSLFNKYKSVLGVIDFPGGEYDMDTEEDIQKWRKSNFS